MRAVLLLAAASGLAGLGACADEDSGGPWRPGGGGGGGGGVRPPVDAPASEDAPAGDGGSEVTGLICVVTDLRAPDACPTVASQAGVTVSIVDTAATTTSGADGRFTLPVSAASVVLDAGAGSATFERSLVPATVGGLVIETPVVTQAAYAAVIDSLTTVVPDGNGTVVVYVKDGTSPAPGVAFAMIAGSSVAPYYDDGGATAWTQSGGTGAAGVALLVDVPAGNVTLDGVAADSRVAQASVPVLADAITFVEIALVAPP